MNNKRNTYLLIAALLGIWGIIGYKFISKLDADDTVITSTNVKPVSIPINEIDSFTILANYSDPFKVSKHKKRKNSVPRNVNPVRRQTAKKPVVVQKSKANKVSVSHIKYYGVISNSKTGKKVGILYINDKEFLVSNGTEIQSGKVVSVLDDKVKIEYKENIFEIERAD